MQVQNKKGNMNAKVSRVSLKTKEKQLSVSRLKDRVKKKRGKLNRERKRRQGAWQPPKVGYLTPHTSRPSGQLTAISSMR